MASFRDFAGCSYHVLQYCIPSNDPRCQLCCIFKLAANCHWCYLLFALQRVSALFGQPKNHFSLPKGKVCWRNQTYIYSDWTMAQQSAFVWKFNFVLICYVWLWIHLVAKVLHDITNFQHDWLHWIMLRYYYDVQDTCMYWDSVCKVSMHHVLTLDDSQTFVHAVLSHYASLCINIKNIAITLNMATFQMLIAACI
jgi:hypothetical protein